MVDSYDFICVGNSVIDIFLKIDDQNRYVSFNEDTKNILIPLGEKINLDGYKICLGGSASNVAVGLSRLGMKVMAASQTGDDEFSKKILSILKKEAVSTDGVKTNSGMDSSFSFVMNYKNERTIFSQHMDFPGSVNIGKQKSHWIYLASLGKDWEETYEKVVPLISDNSINLAFNPGIIEIEAQSPIMYKLIAACQLLILNKEEANHLVEHSNREIVDLLREVKKLGPKIVIITDGKNGSYLMDDREHSYYLNCLPSKMVDPTGAGDAYSTGFLFGHISGKTIEESMLIASSNAAYVSEKIGAQDGLISISELEEKLKKFEQYAPQIYVG